MKRLLLFCVLIFVAQNSYSQGETCATAVAVTPGTHTADGPSSGAGIANVCFATDGTNADWYSYTPAGDGTISIDACGGSIDTRLSFYDVGCGGLNCVGSNDDACGGTGYSSELTSIPVVGGTLYHIEWDDRWSGTGFDWTLSFVPAPMCTPGMVSGETLNTATCPATLTVDFTVDDMGDAMSYTVTNDQGGTNPMPITATGAYSVTDLPNNGSDVTITLTHNADPACNIVLNPITLSCPPGNDDCGSATVIDCSTTALAGTTNGASDNGDAVGCGQGKGVWYQFAGNDMNVSLEVIPEAGFDIEIGIATSADCIAFTGVLCRDGSTGTETTSFLAVTGMTYYIYLGHFNDTSTGTGDFDLTITLCEVPPMVPDNDDCVDATTLICGSTLMGETTGGATGGLGTSCIGTQGDNIWYEFVGTGDDITITTTASVEEAQVDVYESTDGTCGTISCLAGASAGSGENPTIATFSSVNGTTYFIAVGNWINGDPGVTFDLELTCEVPPPPPPNDAIANAIVLADGDTFSGSTEDASNLESLAPCDGGGGDFGTCIPGSGTTNFAAGVWYKYTATVSGSVSVEVSGFDTEIQVWEGAIGSLTCVGGDDDGGVSPGSKFCWLTQQSFAPIDYFIYIDGHSTSTGNYSGSIAQVALPIELVSFEAKATKEGNKIMWTTASEINNDYQTVVKSYNGKRGWTEVETVKGSAKSTETKYYEVMDENPYGVTYYRLRSVDLDGSVEFSGVVSVTRKGDKRFVVSPNPTSDMINIETSLIQDGNVSITIVDLAGKLLHSETVTMDAGANIYSYDMSSLSTGMYMLSVRTDTDTYIERIVKQ